MINLPKAGILQANGAASAQAICERGWSRFGGTAPDRPGCAATG
jgi:hypothetical protein